MRLDLLLFLQMIIFLITESQAQNNSKSINCVYPFYSKKILIFMLLYCILNNI